jgi:y4mF family transcriptional regulator
MNTTIKSATDLGKAIHRTRKNAKLTQATAAGLCGVSVPFFNAIENGKGTAQIDKVLHVCHQLGIQITAHEPGDES